MYNIMFEKIITSQLNIIVFGAGLAGQGTVKMLRALGVEPAYFFDNRASIDAKQQLLGLPIKGGSLSLLNKQKICFVLAVHDMDEAIAQLKNNGIANYLPAYYLLKKCQSKDILSFMEYQKIEAIYYYYEHYLYGNGVNLHTLDFVITEKCSLKCKECSNLMQYYQKPVNYDFGVLKSGIDNITNIIDELYEIRLIGGEPFVNPVWTEIIKYIAGKQNIIRISIYTNGTIIPTDEQCEIIKSANAWLSVSDYHELSKIDRLKEKLLKYDIPYEIKSIPFWTKCADIHRRKRNPDELKNVYSRCCARNLTTVIKNGLYPCPFIANAINLQAIPHNKTDYVCMDNGKLPEIRAKLGQLLNREYFLSCDYCPGRPIAEDIKESDKIAPHEQIKKPLTYSPAT